MEAELCVVIYHPQSDVHCISIDLSNAWSPAAWLVCSSQALASTIEDGLASVAAQSQVAKKQLQSVVKNLNTRQQTISAAADASFTEDTAVMSQMSDAMAALSQKTSGRLLEGVELCWLMSAGQQQVHCHTQIWLHVALQVVDAVPGHLTQCIHMCHADNSPCDLTST